MVLYPFARDQGERDQGIECLSRRETLGFHSCCSSLNALGMIVIRAAATATTDAAKKEKLTPITSQNKII